jgi:hypothetical protein
MKSVRVLFLTLALATAFAAVASAQTCTPRIDHRQARQHARIQQGVRSGELTRGEAMRLREGERHINRLERRARSDGFVTARERARIGHAQNRESRHIYRYKHNGLTR